MTNAKEQLRDVIRGVVTDIYKAEQAIALTDRIGEDADTINRNSFGDLFGNLQGRLTDIAILSVNKIFERQKSKYPLRSIPAALDILDKGKVDISQRHIAERKLLALGESVSKIKTLSDQALTKMLTAHLKKKLPMQDPSNPTELCKAMEAFKVARDKQVAHHEAVEAQALPKATWAEMEKLLEGAKEVVGAMDAYLDTGYEDDNGYYALSDDATGAGRALSRLLKKAGLAK